MFQVLYVGISTMYARSSVHCIMQKLSCFQLAYTDKCKQMTLLKTLWEFQVYI